MYKTLIAILASIAIIISPIGAIQQGTPSSTQTVSPGPVIPGFQLASPANYLSPPVPEPGSNLDLTGIPERVPGNGMIYFPILATAFPGWTNGNLIITDILGNTVPYAAWLPTNHTAEIYVMTGTVDFVMYLTVQFGNKTFFQEFYVVIN